MLERTGHLFQHATVDFHRTAANVEIDALVDFFRSLPRDAIQTFRDTGELHHAHAHQILLQITRQTPLRGQVVAGIVDGACQILLHRADVVDAFRHHAGQLLQARKTVEFERIEFAIGGVRHARRDLRFRLHFDFAQLDAQARYVFRHFRQGLAQGADFGFKLGT